MQFVMSVFLVLAGLWLALFADTSGRMELFGWVLVLIGALGLLARSALAGRRRPCRSELRLCRGCPDRRG